jgi:hypothetical protein
VRGVQWEAQEAKQRERGSAVISAGTTDPSTNGRMGRAFVRVWASREAAVGEGSPVLDRPMPEPALVSVVLLRRIGTDNGMDKGTGTDTCTDLCVQRWKMNSRYLF